MLAESSSCSCNKSDRSVEDSGTVEQEAGPWESSCESVVDVSLSGND